MARLSYVEFPARSAGATKTFYEGAFGWVLMDFGPTYAATTSGDVDIGLQGDLAEASQCPLPVIQVENLEASLAAVLSAGGRMVKPIFQFPGGRRFHVLDPSGNEIAVMQPD